MDNYIDMNWYFYWYYTIYSIYKRFSSDEYFNIFATSMFSFFVASFVIGTLSYAFILLGEPKLLYNNNITIVIIGLCIFISNYILFLPKQRQLEQYEKYKAVQSTTKNIIAILFSILSIAIFFAVIIQGRKYYIGA